MAQRTATPEPVTGTGLSSAVADLTGADLGSLRPGDGSALAHAIGRVAREAAAPGQVSAGFESSM